MNEPQDDCKATAILAGFLRQHVATGAEEPVFRETAWEFAKLLAAVTSTDAEIREAAKNRVRQLAKLGGWTAIRHRSSMPVEDVSQQDDPNQGETTPKKRAGTWSNHENESVSQQWSASKRDAEAIRSISSTSGRSPLAIVIRLHRLGLLQLDQGDVLCRQVQAPKLLSEVECQVGK